MVCKSERIGTYSEIYKITKEDIVLIMLNKYGVSMRIPDSRIYFFKN